MLLRSRSLFWQLLLLFLLVVLVAVITMGISMNWLAQHDLENYGDHNTLQKGNAQTLATTLNSAFLRYQSREQIQALVEHLAQTSGTHMLLIDQQQHVRADSLRSFLGQTLSPSQDQGKQQTRAATFSCSMLIESSNLPVLLAYLGREPPCVAPFTILSLAGDAWTSPLGVSGYMPFTFNRVVIASANDILLFSMLIGGVTAFLLAVLFAWTMLAPLKALTRAARCMEQGDLNQSVRIRAGGELALLGNTFNTMAASLQRAEHLRRSMVNDIAHELRTPLATIQAYLDALADHVLEPTAEVVASLQEEGLFLGCLVGDLQELSLAEAGRLSLNKEPLALQMCLQDALQSVQPGIVSKHIELILDLAPNLPLVEADAIRIGQILRNLLHNAIRHTPAGGTIRVGARATEQAVQVSVQDTGEGIAAAHLPYVFERFYRVDASRSRQTGGTGLGLAIVKQFVQAHGGQVTVESAPGEGACFYFTLPLALSLPQTAIGK
jgi:signal transduction histidine kinase